ncbi:hypothetical protein [Amycolatopsis acidicola]|nr:hypothetical protein [Amycolatopsis acidicola]
MIHGLPWHARDDTGAQHGRAGETGVVTGVGRTARTFTVAGKGR